MSIEQEDLFVATAKALAPDMLARFRQALELGHWPDGRKVTLAQKAILMESVLLAEAAQGVPEDQRTGYIDRSSKRQSASAPQKSKAP